MAAATAAHGGYLATNLRCSTRSPPRLPLQVTGKINSLSSPPPIFISTNVVHVNPHHLRDLYVLCNHSSHRFPVVDAVGTVEPDDFFKLCTAVSHSSIVVSAFTKPEFVALGSSSWEVETKLNGIGGDWIRKLTPVTPENGQLIGFGRAVSDCGLTASIYDVMATMRTILIPWFVSMLWSWSKMDPSNMTHERKLPRRAIVAIGFLKVHPALQGRGIGRMIVQRITRVLTSRGIYDIGALCSDQERLFFEACGFGDDPLESTTMMYTRTRLSHSRDERVTTAGRKLLKIPPER